MYKETMSVPAISDKKTEIILKDNSIKYKANILPFSHSAGEKEVWFTTSSGNGEHRFAIDTLPESARGKFTGMARGNEYVYTSFTQSEDGIPVSINLSEHPAIARAYYTKIIRDLLEPVADVTFPNYLNDTQFWFRDDTQSCDGYEVYKKYSLRVQNDSETGMPELLISYDGISRVASACVSIIESKKGFTSEMFKKVIFRKHLCGYEVRPDEAKYNAEEVFPLLNNKLIRFLNLQVPVNQNKNKHQEFFNEIKWLYTTHLNTVDFRKVILHSGSFKEVKANDRYTLANTKVQLKFGGAGVSDDIHTGFRNYGPAQLPKCSAIHYFFIYDETDQDGMKRFRDFLTNNNLTPNRITTYTRLPMVHSEQHDIAFNRNDDPLNAIRQSIRQLELNPGHCYFAFFINPWTQWEGDINKWKIYHRVKEALLLRKIQMQNMDSSKLTHGALQYFISNLAAAMVGKLGGIPWKLDREESKELIIGFAIARSKKHNVAWTGSSYCFSNDGVFQQSDSFRASDTYLLVAKVEEALLKYRRENAEARRIIIHYDRKMSRRVSEPIEKMLRSLKVNIPVIIVSINKTYSNSLAVNASGANGGLPKSGEYFRTSPNHYLLYINERADYTLQPKSMPLPLRISLSCKQKELIGNDETISEIFQQVHDFCFLYWRSMKHSRRPVTVVYPEMLAGILPWFECKVLPDGLQKCLIAL